MCKSGTGCMHGVLQSLVVAFSELHHRTVMNMHNEVLVRRTSLVPTQLGTALNMSGGYCSET